MWTVGTIALHHHDDGRESNGQSAPSVCRSARVCVPISMGVCGDPCLAALISVAVVCGDQYNAVLISVMGGRLGRSPCITMTMVVNQMACTTA